MKKLSKNDAKKAAGGRNGGKSGGKSGGTKDSKTGRPCKPDSKPTPSGRCGISPGSVNKGSGFFN